MRCRVLVTMATLPLLLAGCASAASDADRPSGPAASAGTAGTGPALVSEQVTSDLRALEARYEARVGLAVRDTATDRVLTHRGDERFGFASTLKAFAAADMLRRVPPAQRDERVTWTQADVDAAGYSPVTERHLDDGLTLAQLAEATVRESDNLALNLVLRRLGGPSGLQAGMEELGDTTTRVVNEEPALNVVEPGSTDDTTTAVAFADALEHLVLGDHLTESDRALMLRWMSDNATGDPLVRAGAPRGWEVVDKSGGAGAIRNDVAVVTPPGREPVVVVVLTEKDDRDAAYDDELVAEVARVALSALS